MISSTDPRINEWIQRFFFGLASFVLLYCANQIKELSYSVNELNLKLAIHIAKLEGQSVSVSDHENRLRHLERK